MPALPVHYQMYEVMERFYERQFTTLDSTAERHQV